MELLHKIIVPKRANSRGNYRAFLPNEKFFYLSLEELQDSKRFIDTAQRKLFSCCYNEDLHHEGKKYYLQSVSVFFNSEDQFYYAKFVYKEILS